MKKYIKKTLEYMHSAGNAKQPLRAKANAGELRINVKRWVVA